MVDIDSVWDFDKPGESEVAFRAIAAEAMTQVARTLGLQRKFEEGHAVLDSIVTVSPRIMVRMLLERGRLFNSSGDRGQARELFAEAYDLGVQAGEEALAVDAAHMVAIAESPQEAKAWNEKALDLAAKSEDPKARKWRASLLNNLGWTYHGEGNFEHALQLFREARDCREQMDQVKEERIARWCVARCLRSLSQFEKALAMQQALLGERNLSDAPNGYIEEEIGENLHALGRIDEAKPFLQVAYARLSADPGHVANDAARLERLKDLAG